MCDCIACEHGDEDHCTGGLPPEDDPFFGDDYEDDDFEDDDIEFIPDPELEEGIN